MVPVSVLREALAAQRAGLPPWDGGQNGKARCPNSVRTAHSFLVWMKTKSSRSSSKPSMYFINTAAHCAREREPLSRAMVGIWTGFPALGDSRLATPSH